MHVVDQLLDYMRHVNKRGLPVSINFLRGMLPEGWTLDEEQTTYVGRKVSESKLRYDDGKSKYSLWLTQAIDPKFTSAYRASLRGVPFRLKSSYGDACIPATPPKVGPDHIGLSVVKSEGCDFELSLKTALVKAGYIHEKRGNDFYLWYKTKKEEIQNRTSLDFFNSELFTDYGGGTIYKDHFDQHCYNCGYDGPTTRKRPKYKYVCKVCAEHFTLLNEATGRMDVEVTLPIRLADSHYARPKLEDLGVRTTNIIGLDAETVQLVLRATVEDYREHGETVIAYGFQSFLKRDDLRTLYNGES